MNSRALAMRDPALAALMGADGDDFGADVRDAFSPGGAYDFGQDPYGGYMGYEFGADAVPGVAPAGLAAAAGVVPRPTADQLMQVWQQHHIRLNKMNSRVALLDPNADSPVKIEGYDFTLDSSFSLGTGGAFNVSDSPDTVLKPIKITSNIPTPGIVYLSEIKVANVDILIGGTQDAFNYGAQVNGQHIRMPKVLPSNKIRMAGNATTFAPSPFTSGTFTFVLSFQGPATVAGGGC